jgi:predicted  nucleic acid-binding Zn-ribbon protein
MTTQNTLSTALKASEPIIQEFVRQLNAEISKLNKQITKLEIEKTKFKDQNKTYKKRVSALQRALDKAKSNMGGDIILQVTPRVAKNRE